MFSFINITNVKDNGIFLWKLKELQFKIIKIYYYLINYYLIKLN